MSRFALVVGITALLAMPQAMADSTTPFKASFLGQVVLPTGLKIDGVEFGGISGLDYDRASDVFYAISDDRSQKAPARFYKMRLDLSDGDVGGIDIISSHTLQGADGKPFAEKNVDPEAIRFAEGMDKLYWSSEGDAAGRPAIYEADLEGAFSRSFDLPQSYLPDDAKTRGVRNNLSLEGLSLSSDAKSLWASTENALVQDGEPATREAGSRARMIGLDLQTGKAQAEYVYETGSIHAKAQKDPFYNDNGLTEILEFEPGNFLALERSYAHGVGNEINLYLAETDGATDINGVDSIIAETEVAPFRKTLLLKIGEGDFGLDIDNVEAMSWGPEIAGRRSLVLASDNNFNPDGQFSQFIVFTLKPVSN